MEVFQGPRRDPQSSIRQYVALEPRAPEHSRWSKYIGAAVGVLITPYFQGLPEAAPPWFLLPGLLGLVLYDLRGAHRKVQPPA